MRVGDVVSKRPRLGFPQRISTPFENIVLRGRFPVPPLMKQVGAEEHALRLFKENAGIPSVRHMRSGQKPKTIPASAYDIIPRQCLSGPYRKIIDAHHCPDEAANRL